MKSGRKLKSLIVFLLLAGALLGGTQILKNVLLAQVRKRIAPAFHFARLRMTAFPPTVTLENVRSNTASPFISAERVALQIPVRSIFSSERPLRVFIDKPVIRAYAPQGPSTEPFNLDLNLPLSISSGILRGGEISYWGRGVTILAKGVQASFRQSRESFVFRAEAADQSIHLASLGRSLEGRSEILVEARGEELILRRMTVQGGDYLVRAKGVLTDPKNPVIDIQASVRGPTRFLADAFELPFDWDGRVEGTARIVNLGGPVRVQASLESRDLELNGLPLGRVAAGVEVEKGRGRVDIEIRKGVAPIEYVDIEFGGGKVTGSARGVHVDAVIREIDLPWPVRSAAWGTFALEDRRLSVRGEFRDDLLLEEGDLFAFRGPIEVTWDGLRRVVFSSERLESMFGAFRVDGELNIDRDVRILIDGEANDIPRGREFTSLVLDLPLDIPEVRGRGKVVIGISGGWSAPDVRMDFDLAPAGFDRFEAAAGAGSVEIRGNEVRGSVEVRDPGLRGRVDFTSRPGSLEVRFADASGELERILPALDLDLPFAGRASGVFELHDEGRGLEVRGDFEAAGIRAFGLDVLRPRGRLSWTERDDRLTLSGLRGTVFGGTFEGDMTLGILSREYDLKAAGEDWDIGSWVTGLRGRLSFDLEGQGHLDRDSARGGFRVRDLGAGPVEGAEAEGEAELTLREDVLGVRLDGSLNGERNPFELSIRYPETGGTFFLSASGTLSDLNFVVPWKGVLGEIRYLAEVRGGADRPADWSGVLDFKGPVFPFPKFAQALENYSGLVRIENNVATVRSLQGQFGGGDVFGSGEIRFGPGGIELVDLQAEGRDMTLALFERTRALADGSFRLLKNARTFTLSGDVFVRQLSWRRELTEPFAFSSTAFPEAKSGPDPFDDLVLDIRLRADDNATMDNALGRVEGRFDLTLAGTLASPVVLGDIEGLRGEVRFQDRDFRLLRARLSFFSPVSIEPYLDFRGETYLKDYRVTFSVSGGLERLRPEFTSSPPLPPEDVLALLALGDSFQRSYSSDASSQQGTGSLLSFQLADEAARRAERLFSLDRFRIDPFVLGASTEMTARLTVGKRIASRLFLLYSTNLTSQREEIIRLEWEFSESFSLVGMRDERGRLSLDAKLRKRF